jgi:DNA polymerase-1
MKYIVTNAERLFDWEVAKRITVQEALIILKQEKVLGFDTETRGLNAYKDAIICSQFGNSKFQILFDHETIDIQLLKPLLEGDTLFVGQNIKFDLRFLYVNGIFPRHVYDTYLAEILLTNGLKYSGRTLKDLAWDYLEVVLDKSVRGSIIYKGLTEETINYSLRDVEFILSIRELQLERLKELDLLEALFLENSFVKVLAYIEHSGIKLDTDKWMAKFERKKKELLLAKENLNLYLWDSGLKKYFDSQLDLFSTERRCLLNWSSPTQVLKLFKSLGINTTEYKKGEELESVDAKILEKQKEDFPVIPPYLKYKELQKECGTYGDSWLGFIETSTGRIHTNFSQIMDTTRISSGDKSRGLPNLCNLPADAETRACFVSEPGNVLIDCDYSGQETVILANLSQDRGMIEFFKSGFGDQHCFVASKMFDELNGLTVDEIKSKHKDKRQLAKSAGFAIAYGGNGTTIARGCNISEEQGQLVYNAYFKAFPDLPDYFKRGYKKAVENGYITFNDVTRHKFFIPNFEEFKTIDSETRDTDFWRIYRENKNDVVLKEKVKSYFKTKGEIQRKSQNYPIQGTGSAVSKYALIMLFNTIVREKLLNKIKIVNFIYDEILLEVPKDLSEKWAVTLENCMVKAGDPFCRIIPLKAEASINTYWKH